MKTGEVNKEGRKVNAREGKGRKLNGKEREGNERKAKGDNELRNESRKKGERRRKEGLGKEIKDSKEGE